MKGKGNGAVRPLLEAAKELQRMLDELEERVARLESSGKRTGARTPMNTGNPVRVDQAARILGTSKQNVYNLVHKKRIPFHKSATGTLYFDRGELLEWAGVLEGEGGKE